MQRGVARDYIWFSASCARDYDVALRTIRELCLGNDETSLDEACARAGALFRSSQPKASVKALSNALYAHERFDGRQVDSIVCPFLGGPQACH